jgi:phage baseplate assembly protein W
MTYVYTDLNVRLDEVDPNDHMTITDSLAIKQSLIRLLNTREGEIPNYRAYGLNVRKFQQYPLNVNTGNEIFEHIKDKIDAFEKRVVVLDDESILNINYDEGNIGMQIYVQYNNTGEVIVLPNITIPTGI